MAKSQLCASGVRLRMTVPVPTVGVAAAGAVGQPAMLQCGVWLLVAGSRQDRPLQLMDEIAMQGHSVACVPHVTITASASATSVAR